MYGTIIGNTIGSVVSRGSTSPVQSPSKNINPPEQKLRGLNYVADYGGCGHWRLMWPTQMLNATQQAIIHNSSIMIDSESYYKGLTSIRLQRQVAAHQLKFFKFLQSMKSKHDLNLIYEIDDVFIYEDIPLYNRFRSAYSDPSIKKIGTTIMKECDEVTVTCSYMKEYYSQYCDNITIIPNYMPQSWIDRYYDESVLYKNYDKHVKKKRKPRVLYSASGAHFDTTGYNKYRDDFTHVNNVIRSTCNEIQWVFLGAFPMPLKDLVKSGKIEFHNWSMLPYYPSKIVDLQINLTIAPLEDNIFNRCKSDLKLIEPAALGLPAICQDIVTYKNAPYKFTTGSELIDQIKSLTTNRDTYIKSCRKSRAIAETRWLDDKLNMFVELYRYPYKSSQRKELNLLQQDTTI